MISTRLQLEKKLRHKIKNRTGTILQPSKNYVEETPIMLKKKNIWNQKHITKRRKMHAANYAGD